MVLLSSFSLCSHLPSGHSEESKVGNMKSAKQQVNHGQSGESQPPLSPLRSALNSVVTSSQAYETYIDNGLICLKHKIRNIEKKKLKLEDYKDRLKNGEPLNSDQLEAVEKYDEVLHNLEFAKELQKTFSALSQDLLKAQKKAQRREHMIKLEAEKRKLRTIFQVQYVLQNFTQEHVQEDFKGGLNGAVYLPSRELDYLIKFSKLTCPERNESLSIEDQMEQSSLYFWDLLEGSEKAVAGTTYHCIAEKSKVYQSWSSHSVAVTVYILVLLTSFSISSYKHMKDLLSKLLTSGYFESIPVPRNNIIKQKEDLDEEIREKSRKKQSLQTELVKESESLMEHIQPEIQPQEVPKLLNQSADTPTAPPNDSVLRKEKLQDLMSQIQGTYNFMQESVLDFDKPSSAIPSPQLPSVIPDSPEASIDQKLPNQNDFLQEPLQAATSPVKHSTNSLVIADQTSSESETELETPQAAIPPSKQLTSLPSANLPMSQASQEQVFQSPPASSSTVFNVNAPLPSRKEQETKDSPYSSGYNQSYTTASTQTAPQCQLPSTHVEQATLSQEQTANSQLDGTIQVSSGSLAFYPAQTNVFPRSTQSYLSNRGSIRGCTRGGRLLTNSFRSPGGYKGFDTYRGSPVIANGSYGHLQFQVREYSGTPYSQRDTNFQQCYKRGGLSSGSRTSSRAGWSDSSQVNSPERENETFNSVDSGQGDSRSMTPVDVPVTSPAATILPVHVYPLPQQMRVAFSAARTSNLAPGTLDQPIVFDLLLNNLGETFDLQLGRFNCPVNGTYVFIFHMLKLAVNVPLYVNLMKNEEVLVSAYANDGAPDHETASNHAILQLFQGDQIWLRLHRGAIYGSSWKYSTFSGYLLYQD
ncbi:caprin-2 isoform X6 [Petaurus breviceps papuanus]|uniref:caprin-2 isoform X6 n=1 Tax=Petaurus breviceps papuanus TaxID=3040969 RepID=UPI0036DEB6F0